MRFGGLAIAGTLLGVLAPVLRAQVYWDNSNGNSAWGTAANWSNNTVPTSSTALIFDATYVSTNQTLDLASTDRLVQSLTFSSALDYTLNNAATNRDLEIHGSGTNFTQSGSGNVVINAPVWLNVGLVTAGSGTGLVTINGVISDSGGTDLLQKGGTFTLVLNGANTQDGTVLNAGTIEFGHNNAGGSGSLTLNGGTIQAGGGTRTLGNTITVGGDFGVAGTNALVLSGGMNLGGATRTVTTTNTASTTFSGAISNGALTKAGAGTLVLSGANTYTGATTINAGTLQLGAANRLNDATAVTVASGGTFDLNNFAETVGSIAGAGNITLGNATLTAGGNNSSTTFSGAISETGTLVKTGSGTLTLSGANSHSGGTTITAGTLEAGNDAAFGTGTLTLNGGTVAASGGARILSNAVAVAASSTVGGANDLTLGTLTNTFAGNPTLTVNNTGTTTIGGINLSNSATNRIFTIGGTGNTVISGAVANGGTSVASGLTKTGTGTLTLGGANTYDGLTTAANGTLILNGNNSGATGGVALSGGALQIGNASALGTGTFTLSGGSFDNSTGAALTLATNNAQAWNGNFTFAGTNDLSLGTGAVAMSANRTVTIGGGTLTVGGIISGAGFGLTKSGSGTLALSGANTYSGATTVSQGTLQLNADAPSGAAGTLGNAPSNVVLNDANTGAADTALLLGASGLTVARNITVANSGTGTATLGSEITSGTGAFTGNIVLNRTAMINADGASNITFSTGAISGTGGLTKTGTGTATLSGNNSYAGTTTISAGTVRATTNATALGAGALALGGGALQLANDTGLNFARNTTISTSSNITSDRLTAGAGVTHTLGTLSMGAQTLTVSAGSNVTSGTAGLTFGAATLTGSGATFDTGTNTNLTLGAIGGNFGFSKQGAGTLTLNTAGTRTSGGTTLTAGSLRLGAGNALGTAGFALNLNGGTLQLAPTANVNTTFNATNVVVGGPATIASDRGTAGAGLTHTLGTLSLGTQTLAITAGSNVTSGAAGITFGATTLTGNNATFDAAASTNLTLGALGGNFSFIKQGAGTLTLNTAGTRTSGTTTVSTGTLQLGTANALGTTATTLNLNGGTLQLAPTSNANTTFNGANVVFGATSTLISDRGTAGAGLTHTLGTLSIGSQTLNLSAGANVTSGTAGLIFGATTLTGNVTLSPAASSQLTLGTTADSGGARSVTKTGAGTLVYTGANSYTGGTTLSAGTLTVNSGASLAGATGALIVDAGTLNLNNTAQTVASLTGTGGTINLGSGHTLTVNTTGSNSFSGALGSSGTLTKSGSGSLTLNGNSSTFTGAVNVSQGTLILASGNALGSGTGGTTLASGAMLQLQGGISAGNGTLSLVGTGVSSNGALTNLSGNNTWSGNVTLTGNATIGTQAGILTLGASSPAFTPSGDTEPSESGFITLGGNTLTFSGNGTGIVVNERIRDFAGQISRTSYDNPPLTLVASPQTTTPGNVVVNMAGNGYVHYLANANSYTGTTTVQNGTLILDTITNSGAPHDPVTSSFHAINGNLVIGDGTGSAETAVVQLGSGGSANEVIAHTSDVTINSDGRFNVNNQAQTIDNLTFTGGKVTLGTGTLFLNNDITVNAYSGALPSTNAGALIDGSSGYLSLTLQRTVGVDTGPDATRTFNVALGSGHLYDLQVSGIIQNGNLVKAGSGVMMLNNNNTYVGTTQVNGGILNIQTGTDGSSRSGLGSGNGTDAQGTTVASGATLQVQGGIAITSEKLNLAGTGYSSLGALNNLSGSNTIGAGSGTLVNLNSDATIATSGGTLTVATNIGSSSNNALTANTASGTTITVSGGINTGTGSTTTVTKTGSGTLILSGNSSYQGATNINAGVVSLQHNFGLGANTTGTNGTFVTSGAELQLSNVANGNLTIGGEALSLNGAGIGGAAGALHNVAGNNSFGGLVTIASASTLMSTSGTLTLAGGTASSNQALTIAGPGNITVSGNMANGSGTLTKNGAGTFTFSGSTGTVGDTQLNAGTIAVGGSSTLNTGEFGSLAGTTLNIASGGTVIGDYAVGSTTFAGTISAAGGTFQKDGAGTLVFTGSFDAGANSTLVLNGGTLSLLGSQITFGTIHITGNTVLDFNNSAGTFLSSNNLIIDSGVTITVNNWVPVANNAAASTVWYARSTGTINNTITLSGTDIVGGAPLTQITFTDYNLTTTWVSGNHDGWFDHEIRPTPEPATYGALLLAGCCGLFGWRRYRASKHASR